MDQNLTLQFIQLLTQRKLTIAFAESITAGLLCSSVASLPGASSILKGGIITYDEKLKTRLLNVKPSTLEQFTAESMQTTIEMATGLKALELGADINVAITGVASQPTNDYKIRTSVGDSFIAVVYKGNLFTREFSLPGHRNEVREQAVQETFRFIMDLISNEKE